MHVPIRHGHGAGELSRDVSGQSLRHYVAAMAAGTVVAVVLCTLFAERLYYGFRDVLVP